MVNFWVNKWTVSICIHVIGCYFKIYILSVVLLYLLSFSFFVVLSYPFPLIS